MTRLLPAILLSAAVHAAQPWTLDDLWAWHDITEARIRPDGSSVVWVESSHDRAADAMRANLWIVPTLGGSPIRLTNGSWRDASPRWASDGARLAFLSDRSGVNQIWIRRLDAADLQLTRLDSPPLTFAWSADDTTIAYTARLAAPASDAAWAPASILPMLRRPPPRIGLFVIPAAGGVPRSIPLGDLEIQGAPAWMPDGRSLIVSATTGVYALPLGGGAPRALTKDSATHFEPLPSPDGSRIAWIARDDKPQSYITAKLYVANSDGSRVKVLAGALDRDVNHIQWSSDSRTVYFLADDGGVTKVWAARADGNVRQVTTERARFYDFSLADNGRGAAVRSPGEVIAFPVDVAGAPVKLAAPNAPLIADRATVAPEEIHFTSDGKSIQGWIVKPPGFDRQHKYPLLLDVQDGPRRMCGVEFNLRAQIFAARGLVVLCANPRGTPGFGEEFGNLLRTRNPGDDFDDLMRGADHLIAQGFIDAARVHFMGGLLAAWAIGHTDRLRSAVAVDPVVVFGDPQHSPLFFADQFKTPTLVIDTGAGPGAAELYAALQERHVESALVTLPASDRPSRRILQTEAILGWLLQP